MFSSGEDGCGNCCSLSTWSVWRPMAILKKNIYLKAVVRRNCLVSPYVCSRVCKCEPVSVSQPAAVYGMLWHAGLTSGQYRVICNQQHYWNSCSDSNDTRPWKYPFTLVNGELFPSVLAREANLTKKWLKLNQRAGHGLIRFDKYKVGV